VDLRVDDATYEAIQRIADQDHRKVSDVVRDAINPLPSKQADEDR
jgi:predicted transcriptional regulator